MVEAATNPQIDVYDEEFFNNMKIAKNLIAHLTSTNDKEICKKWIRKLIDLKSTDPTVKKNRNTFFRYLMQILHKSIRRSTEYPHYDDRYGPQAGAQDDSKQFTSRWSSDKRTYIAAKPIPGKGTLVYLAVAKDPSLGWDHPQL